MLYTFGGILFDRFNENDTIFWQVYELHAVCRGGETKRFPETTNNK